MLIEENNFINYTYTDSILYITIKNNSVPTTVEWEFSKKFMLSFYESAKQTKSRFSLIFDLRKLCILPFKMYQEWADLFISNKELTELYVNKTGIINNNKIIKGAINIFFNLYTTVRPLKLVSSMDEAHKFINDDLHNQNQNQQSCQQDQ